MKHDKKIKLTINYLDKYKKDILIEGDRKTLIWLASFINEAAKRKISGKYDCSMSISPYSVWRKLFSKNSDLGLTIHRVPCSDRRGPIKGYSDKKQRMQFYSTEKPKFTVIYNRIMKLWPKQIKLSSVKKNLDGEAWFPALSDAWSDVDNIVDPLDVYGSLMVWTMYGVFTDMARNAIKKGRRVLNIHRVNKRLVEAAYFNNLKAPGYSKERKRYIRK